MILPRFTDLVRNEQGAVVGFVLRALVVFGLLGFVAYESGQIVVTELNTREAAEAAAQAGADAFISTGREARARAEVARTVRTSEPNARLASFHVAIDGAVTVALVQRAPTVVVHRVSFLRRFGVARAIAVKTHLP